MREENRGRPVVRTTVASSMASHDGLLDGGYDGGMGPTEGGSKGSNGGLSVKSAMKRAKAGARARKVLFCAVHGPIEADRALSSRGHRFRCPVEACGRWLSARPADERREGAPSLPVAVGSDPEILALVKEREKARLEGEILELRGYIKRLGAREERVAALSAKLDEIGKRLDDEVLEEIQGLREELSSTPLRNLRARFKCDGCGKAGLVAVRVKCTACDSETWHGWWPK